MVRPRPPFLFFGVAFGAVIGHCLGMVLGMYLRLDRQLLCAFWLMVAGIAIGMIAGVCVDARHGRQAIDDTWPRILDRWRMSLNGRLWCVLILIVLAYLLILPAFNGLRK